MEAVAVSVASDTVLGDLSDMMWKREFTKIMVQQGDGGAAKRSRDVWREKLVLLGSVLSLLEKR